MFLKQQLQTLYFFNFFFDLRFSSLKYVIVSERLILEILKLLLLFVSFFLISFQFLYLVLKVQMKTNFLLEVFKVEILILYLSQNNFSEINSFARMRKMNISVILDGAVLEVLETAAFAIMAINSSALAGFLLHFFSRNFYVLSFYVLWQRFFPNV